MADQARIDKVNAFLDEVEAISAKYQLRLVPFIEVTVDGIIPKWSVKDILPPEPRPVPPPPPPPAPTVETPKVEEPVNPPAEAPAEGAQPDVASKA